MDPDIYEAEVPADGFEHIDAALARGRGAIIVTPHFGNWDLAGGLVGARGYPIIAPADRFEPPAVDALVRVTPRPHRPGTLPLDQGSLRGIFTALRRNQIVAILFDRPQRDRGRGGLASSASRPGCPPGRRASPCRSRRAVLFGYVMRQPGDRTFFGHFSPLSLRPPATRKPMFAP